METAERREEQETSEGDHETTLLHFVLAPLSFFGKKQKQSEVRTGTEAELDTDGAAEGRLCMPLVAYTCFMPRGVHLPRDRDRR